MDPHSNYSLMAELGNVHNTFEFVVFAFLPRTDLPVDVVEDVSCK